MLPSGGVTGFSAKEGEEYFFTALPGKSADSSSRCGTIEDPLSVLGRFRVERGKTLYTFFEDPAYFDPSCDDIELLEREQLFMDQYHRETGRPWIHHFGFLGPRARPSLPMWDTSEGVGTVHRVESSAGYWRRGATCDVQESGSLRLTLTAVSSSPRVFVIENFISSFEADALIKQAAPRLALSTVGSPLEGMRQSSVRTSTNTWLERESSHISKTLYDRAADVLGISRRHLRHADNAEDLQVVHYDVGQKYNAHYDFVVNGFPESRFITLLIYLSDMASPTAGGETAFPKALQPRKADSRDDGSSADDSDFSSAAVEEMVEVGFKVRPVKGSAVLFYNFWKTVTATSAPYTLRCQ
jgi:hypothetical protein